MEEETLEAQTTEEESRFDYKKLFTQQYDLMKRIKKICPKMDNNSGIYFYIRTDENGGKHCYIGKAVHLLKRSASHFRGWNQRIDVSLKKRGLWSEDNPYGWKLNFLHFPEDKLDEKENYYIKKYQLAGYEMYNIESGGTMGKEDINERKSTKGFRDGIAQGKKTLAKELLHIIETHLVITLKKDTKTSQKALQKFYSLLNPKKEEETTEN